MKIDVHAHAADADFNLVALPVKLHYSSREVHATDEHRVAFREWARHRLWSLGRYRHRNLDRCQIAPNPLYSVECRRRSATCNRWHCPSQRRLGAIEPPANLTESLDDAPSRSLNHVVSVTYQEVDLSL